ncbi:MAG TPA: M28 family peptidase [Myxococcaceae bacterium]|nr:M28 family peptidase [Myxococcaceae bacterium]
MRLAVLTLAPLALAFGLVPRSARGAELDPEIQQMIARVDADHIGGTIQRLQNFGTRHACSTDARGARGITAARDWIAHRFNAVHGLEVRLDRYTHARCPDAPTFNVVGWLPGTGHPERLIVIGGHYDSRTIDVNDRFSDAPGANDSGSQAALVLEAARALAKHRHDATLVFVTYSGEEQGLFGSGSFARGLAKYFGQATVVANLNADIVGGDSTVNGPTELQQFRLYSPGTPREVGSRTEDGTTDNTSPSRGLMRFIGTWGAAYVPSMQMIPKLREDRPGRGSDHRSFIDLGIPAVRFMETIECSPSPPDNSCVGTRPCPARAGIPANCADFNVSHQHSPFDLAEFVTPEYTARVTQLVVATAASLARAPGAPNGLVVMGDAVNGATITWNPSSTGAVDHYVIAARSTRENFYRQRLRVNGTAQTISPSELGFSGGESFFVSVAAVDAAGHESLFAYPEFRCDAAGCVVPAGALDVTVRQ